MESFNKISTNTIGEVSHGINKEMLMESLGRKMLSREETDYINRLDSEIIGLYKDFLNMDLSNNRKNRIYIGEKLNEIYSMINEVSNKGIEIPSKIYEILNLIKSCLDENKFSVERGEEYGFDILDYFRNEGAI